MNPSGAGHSVDADKANSRTPAPAGDTQRDHPTMSNDLPKIDWHAERRAMQAPAYFERQAMDPRVTTALDRGLSAAERGAKTLRSRERLPDAEIESLNEARRRNGGEL